MNGKSKCKILKRIRKEIAKQNDIEYVTSECKFQGDCTGTCPKCESEVRYLEQELSKRKAAGKTVAVVGIAASLLAGCTAHRTAERVPLTDVPPHTETTDLPEFDGVPTVEPYQEIGEVPYEETEDPLMGEPPVSEDETLETVLEGDVAYVGDEWED